MTPAPELLDVCDRMGMLVLDEAFDCWESGKLPNDYSTLFREWHEKDIRALVRRDRNHPCVIAWSSGNEVREQADGMLSEKLRAIFLSEDSTRPVTAGCDNPQLDSTVFRIRWTPLATTTSPISMLNFALRIRRNLFLAARPRHV